MNHSYQKLKANEEYVFNTKDYHAHKFHAPSFVYIIYLIQSYVLKSLYVRIKTYLRIFHVYIKPNVIDPFLYDIINETREFYIFLQKMNDYLCNSLK